MALIVSHGQNLDIVLGYDATNGVFYLTSPGAAATAAVSLNNRMCNFSIGPLGAAAAVEFTVDTTNGNYGFIAPAAMTLVRAVERHLVAGTDGGSVVGMIKKVASATALAAGTDMLAAAANLKSAANTNVVLTLHGTAANLDVAAGDLVGVLGTGTMTGLVQSIWTLTFVPKNTPNTLPNVPA